MGWGDESDWEGYIARDDGKTDMFKDLNDKDYFLLHTWYYTAKMSQARFAEIIKEFENQTKIALPPQTAFPRIADIRRW